MTPTPGVTTTDSDEQSIEQAAELLYEKFGDWRKTWKQASEQQHERFRKVAREVREVLR